MRWSPFGYRCPVTRKRVSVTRATTTWSKAGALTAIDTSLLTTSPSSTTSMIASSSILSFMACMSKPYTSSQNLTRSSYQGWPAYPDRRIEVCEGTIRPSGWRYLSRAYRTESSMHSYKRQ